MTDEPISAPRPPQTELNEHLCEHPGCKAWGGWGFDTWAGRVKRTEWYCYEHRIQDYLGR